MKQVLNKFQSEYYRDSVLVRSLSVYEFILQNTVYNVELECAKIYDYAITMATFY